MSNNFTLAGMYLLCKCERPELLPFRASNRERLLEHYQTLSNTTLEDLVESYNKNVSIGITGTQAQGLYLLAMHKVFLNKCGRSVS